MDLGALDATAHGSIAQQYGVQGYPTIKYFAQGATEPEDYNGGRTASDNVKFAEEKLGPTPYTSIFESYWDRDWYDDSIGGQ